MLTVEAVTISYPGFEGLYDFTLPRGTLAAVIGPSGGGKTTLFNALGGFETPRSGHMRFDDVDFTTAPPAARPTAMLFQDHNLFPHLSAIENVALGIDPGLRLDASQWREAEHALKQTGLGGMARRLPAALSGGQRQRVALARALVRAKPILLLDEPFGALDPGLRKEMIALVDALRQARGFTVLMSLHTPDDALGLADRMVFIAEGRVQLNETPERVLHSGASEIRRFLGR
jgi:thiamine transport system ATP-binding protein